MADLSPGCDRILTISIIVCLVSLFCVQTIYGSVKIVSVYEFPSDCVDSDNNVRGHMDEWTSSAGACDQRTCYTHAVLPNKFMIKHDCPSEYDIFDPDNCRYVSNSSQSFPDCCPELQCDVGTAVNNTATGCVDLSSIFACTYWKNQTNCTDSVNSLLNTLYNLTLDYCQQTCGYC